MSDLDAENPNGYTIALPCTNVTLEDVQRGDNPPCACEWIVKYVAKDMAECECDYLVRDERQARFRFKNYDDYQDFTQLFDGVTLAKPCYRRNI